MLFADDGLQLAESPTSYSNASSGEEDEADASNGPSGTFEDTEADTMAVSSVACSSESSTFFLI